MVEHVGLYRPSPDNAFPAPEQAALTAQASSPPSSAVEPKDDLGRPEDGRENLSKAVVLSHAPAPFPIAEKKNPPSSLPASALSPSSSSNRSSSELAEPSGPRHSDEGHRLAATRVSSECRKERKRANSPERLDRTDKQSKVRKTSTAYDGDTEIGRTHPTKYPQHTPADVPPEGGSLPLWADTQDKSTRRRTDSSHHSSGPKALPVSSKKRKY
jgi:hypothetical protein